MTQRVPKPEDPAECRGEPRVAGRRVVDVLPCRTAEEMNLIACRVLDCSLHGLALISPEPMVEGEQFLLKLSLAGAAKVVEYTVTRCEPWEPQGYCVAGRVTRFGTPSAERDLEAVMEALTSEPKGK